MELLKKLGHRLNRFRSLRPKDYPLLVEAWLMLAWVDMAIRFTPYGYWRRWLDEGVAGMTSGNEFEIATLIQRSEMAARHHLCSMNCLRRTLAQKMMLARRGLGAHIHIGVRNEGRGIEAHSWLTFNGRVLNDSPDVTERYVELARDQWRTAKIFSDN